MTELENVCEKVLSQVAGASLVKVPPVDLLEQLLRVAEKLLSIEAALPEQAEVVEEDVHGAVRDEKAVETAAVETAKPVDAGLRIE